MIALLLTVTLSDLTVYQTETGNDIFICAEQLQTELINVNETVMERQTRLVSTCGMGCCRARRTVNVPRTVTTQREITVNQPTPLDEAETILREEDVSPKDVVYDLGCGDGRVIILAAREFGSRGVGIDKRAQAVNVSQANKRRNGVADLVKFKQQDLEEADLGDATVVYAYQEPTLLAACVGRIRAAKRVRAAISFRHKWPGVQCRKSGRFWIWQPRRARDSAVGKTAVRRVVSQVARPMMQRRSVRRWGACGS